MTATLYFYMAPQSGIEPPYYALRPLRLINSQVSYQLEYRGINFGQCTKNRTWTSTLRRSYDTISSYTER